MTGKLNLFSITDKREEARDFHHEPNHPFHDYNPPTHYRHLSYYTPPPPVYHHTTPMYHYTTPAAQKAMMDVDFTPIFLALLPLFLCVGALLGKSFDYDYARTITTNTTIPDITISINNTVTTGAADAAAADNNTQQTLILFTNGTYFFPFLTGNIGIGTLGIGKNIFCKNNSQLRFFNFRGKKQQFFVVKNCDTESLNFSAKTIF